MRRLLGWAMPRSHHGCQAGPANEGIPFFYISSGASVASLSTSSGYTTYCTEHCFSFVLFADFQVRVDKNIDEIPSFLFCYRFLFRCYSARKSSCRNVFVSILAYKLLKRKLKVNVEIDCWWQNFS